MNIDMQTYVIYLLVMAGVTLFLRAVPFILLRVEAWKRANDSRRFASYRKVK